MMSEEGSHSDLIWEEVSEDEARFVLSGCNTVSDYKAGMKLASNPLLRYFFNSLIVIGFLGCAVISLAMLTRPEPFESGDHAILGSCFVLMALVILPVAISSYRLRQMARKQQGLFASSHSVFSSGEITTSVEGSKTEYEWSAFSKVLANDQVGLLVFKNSAPPLLLARRKLQPPATWNEFLDFLDLKVSE